MDDRSDDHFGYEEEFHAKDRKLFRKERKRAVAKDRSKFKKTDQDQLKKRAPEAPDEEEEKLLSGRVLAITPEGITVDHEGATLTCVLKGVLKKENVRLKNLVAIGDIVRYLPLEGGRGVIAKVEPRRSILSRADPLHRQKEQLIAVNIDQVMITCSVVLPPLKPPLVDRYIIAARKGNMTPIIIVNKIDLLDHPPSLIDPLILEEEKKLYQEFLKTYRDLNIEVIPVSIETKEGVDKLTEAMRGKTSVFSGQSGVGKTSLINAVTGLSLRIGGMVEKTSKGTHTTTTSHLVPLEGGGFCVDTPGIKSFGLWDLTREEVQAYFSEIAESGSACKYPNCSHLQEPGCAVQKAVEEKRISPLRFASYSALMTSLEEEHRIR